MTRTGGAAAPRSSASSTPRTRPTYAVVDAHPANAADPDFFLRKAIGWALRQYARTDPDWVRGLRRRARTQPTVPARATKHLGG